MSECLISYDVNNKEVILESGSNNWSKIVTKISFVGIKEMVKVIEKLEKPDESENN